MNERIGSAVSLTRRQRRQAIAGWETLRQREREDGLAMLRMLRRAENAEKRLRRMINLWPLWVGVVIGLLSPAILDVTSAVASWCMTVVFPFVVLAKQPEIQAGPITHLLPVVILYLQFPIEGLLATMVLKRNVRPFSAVGQVMLFHFLGLMELWMVNGTGFNFLR